MSMIKSLLAWKMDFLRVVSKKNFYNFHYLKYRFYSVSQIENNKKGLLLGVYSDKSQTYTFTKSAENYNSITSGKLKTLLSRLPQNIDRGVSRIFYDLSSDYLAVCVVGLGENKKSVEELEEINSEKESVRIAAAAGVSALQSLGVEEIDIECFNDAEAAAEGATLKLWRYDELRDKTKRRKTPKLKLYSSGKGDGDQESQWNKGVIKGEAQNLARRLTDTPANLMTPTVFAENAFKLFQGVDKVKVLARDKAWAQEQGMNTFLSVAKGSSEPPVFLEINYQGDSSNSKPVVLIGKGITFDTGGINIKPTSGLTDMRGDKGGASCVLATTHAAAKLGLPINITALIPLCENMPSSRASKPGDVIIAMNGKTVRIDNTDAEGRLILADALTYSKNFNPQFVLDIATLTGAMGIALGSEATGVFTNSNSLWENLKAAGTYTGDRVWRLPLWKGYSKGLTDHFSVDISNVRKGSKGGACSAAAFLWEFVPPVEWLHLDIAGVMGPDDVTPYMDKGMTGRPTRTLIQFLSTLK